jgi:hypothetical protein
MSVTIIVEVRQRTASLTPDGLAVTRSLGFFTDKTMAEQTIWACYREVWKAIHDPMFIPDEWLTQELKDTIVMQGMDRWQADDWNSANPTFFTVKHQLWNQVPSDLNKFYFTMNGSIL